METIKRLLQFLNVFVAKHAFLILVVLVGGVYLFSDDDYIAYEKAKWANDDYAMTDEMEMQSVSMSSMGEARGGAMKMMMPPIANADFVPDAEERKIVKNGSITVEVKDTELAREDLVSKIEKIEGAVTNMNSWEVRPGILAYNLTTRIPAGKLEESMIMVAELGMKKNESFSTQDITATYMDTENRIKNLKSRRDRLREMMDRKTDNLGDVLRIDQELSNVQMQIENLEKSQSRRDTDVAYSTLRITLNPEAQIGDFQGPEWQISTSWKMSVNDLIHSGQGIIDKVIKIIVYIPIWIPIILIIWFVRKKWFQKG